MLELPRYLESLPLLEVDLREESSIFLRRGRSSLIACDSGPYTVETKSIETVDNDYSALLLLDRQPATGQ
jgi:hypothetical protein